MSKVCQITGKKPQVGCNVSHSHRRTKRRFMPNLITKSIYNPETGRYERMRIATSALRTLQKRMK